MRLLNWAPTLPATARCGASEAIPQPRRNPPAGANRAFRPRQPDTPTSASARRRSAGCDSSSAGLSTAPTWLVWWRRPICRNFRESAAGAVHHIRETNRDRRSGALETCMPSATRSGRALDRAGTPRRDDRGARGRSQVFVANRGGLREAIEPRMGGGGMSKLIAARPNASARLWSRISVTGPARANLRAKRHRRRAPREYGRARYHIQSDGANLSPGADPRLARPIKLNYRDGWSRPARLQVAGASGPRFLRQRWSPASSTLTSPRQSVRLPYGRIAAIDSGSWGGRRRARFGWRKPSPHHRQLPRVAESISRRHCAAASQCRGIRDRAAGRASRSAGCPQQISVDGCSKLFSSTLDWHPTQRICCCQKTR